MSSLFIKPAHGEPMRAVPRLELSASEGIKGDSNPDGRSPRQVAVMHRHSLEEHGIDAAGARVNIVLDGGASNELTSGASLYVGNAHIRITFACEPCSHGATMAAAPMRRFRMLERYCGLVVDGGSVELSDSSVRFRSDAYEAVPDTFADRCLWASLRIPPAHVVTGLEFLRAIGASRSYARVLPRWLAQAGRSGAPIHRILTANLTIPSWSTEASLLLANEGLSPRDYRHAQFDLTNALWLS
ncbi:hypothetical protein [Streptomyces sp. NPDC058620]|uniref:hypothetical protein n=1 Tax=Streptomyces sp. NPDC058620 TaxID=3346560 RepID=UPI0036624FC2